MASEPLIYLCKNLLLTELKFAEPGSEYIASFTAQMIDFPARVEGLIMYDPDFGPYFGLWRFYVDHDARRSAMQVLVSRWPELLALGEL